MPLKHTQHTHTFSPFLCMFAYYSYFAVFFLLLRIIISFSIVLLLQSSHHSLFSSHAVVYSIRWRIVFFSFFFVFYRFLSLTFLCVCARVCDILLYVVYFVSVWRAACTFINIPTITQITHRCNGTCAIEMTQKRRLLLSAMLHRHQTQSRKHLPHTKTHTSCLWR